MAQKQFETHSTMPKNSAIKRSSNFRLSATGTSYLIEFDPEYTNNISITILRYVILIVRMLCECLFLGLIMVWLLKKPKSSYPVVDSV